MPLIDACGSIHLLLLSFVVLSHHLKVSIAHLCRHGGYFCGLFTERHSDFVNERVLREVGGLVLQARISCSQALVIHEGKSFSGLLLLPDLVFKLGNIEHESIDLSGPLDQYLTLKVHSESALLSLHPHLEFRVCDSAPILKQTIHLLSVQSVPHISSLTGLALVDTEVIPPRLHDSL